MKTRLSGILLLVILAMASGVGAAEDDPSLRWMGLTEIEIARNVGRAPAAVRASRKKKSYKFVLFTGQPGQSPVMYLLRRDRTIGFITMGSGALTAPQIAQILNTYKGSSSWFTLREMNESSVDKKTGTPTHVKPRRWQRKDRKLYIADLWMRSREGEGTLVAVGNSAAAKAVMSLSVEMGEMANEVFGGSAKRGR